MSVLSSASTKRDTKQFLQTFGSGTAHDAANASGLLSLGADIRAVSESPQFIQGPEKEDSASVDHLSRVAIVKFRDPQSVDDTTFDQVAKMLAQLRTLGLPSVVVVDSAPDAGSWEEWLKQVNHQACRIASAIDRRGGPDTYIITRALELDDRPGNTTSRFTPDTVFVASDETLMRAVREGAVVVVPSYAFSSDTRQLKPVNPNNAVLALTRYLSGLQFRPGASLDGVEAEKDKHTRKASVERIIVIDPVGGTPSKHRSGSAHIFLNMEDEFGLATADIGDVNKQTVEERHQGNLELARDALAMLPSTSSVLMTTPTEAANLNPSEDRRADDSSVFGMVDTVRTRRPQNPLIHNLLTDRPVYSSSLPLGRIQSKARRSGTEKGPFSRTTLAKRGMPVTIYPDPWKQPWMPPTPGAPRLQLTDTCIDLPRLVHLINDSFNRELDVEHYLERVNGNLAGIIIAGEYEGGAILTWERPFGLDEATACRTGRLVPYLDKFAVLKKSQGAGGVADIVFNAMVRDCLPEGVCWRSRKDNPVNKWYFERADGSLRLDSTNWTMFWTSEESILANKRLPDYVDICRNVEPSWADKKQMAD